MSEEDEGIWMRFRHWGVEDSRYEYGFYNKLLYVYSMEDAMKEANEIYERCLSRQFNVISSQNSENTSKPI